ncbi:MAG: hypothetical protein KIT84_44875 [Labilithrix sp.]|nr:hypothetical protein [Labilithrix sp.]MCW5818216.1 hypothetical protein [Labilithrix sp.]
MTFRQRSKAKLRVIGDRARDPAAVLALVRACAATGRYRVWSRAIAKRGHVFADLAAALRAPASAVCADAKANEWLVHGAGIDGEPLVVRVAVRARMVTIVDVRATMKKAPR